MNRILLHLSAVALLVAGSAGAATDYAKSILRVRVTSQSWDFHRPWQKGAPEARESFGVLLEGNKILVPASMVADATFVELERLISGDKQQATVSVVDYVANLAVVTPNDPAFLAGMRPVAVGSRVKVGDSVDAVQYQANDQADISEGTLKEAEVTRYPVGVASLLTYRIKIDLGQNFGGRMVPFFRKGKLIGLGTGYGTSTQLASAIPAPVIAHFLKDAADGSYEGFPRAGFASVPIEDPALRRYVKLGESESGIYITSVQPGSAAADAGLKPNDVLTRVDGHDIDKYAEYDDPEYGRISVAHLTTTRYYAGDTIDFHIIREGERMVLPVTLTARDPRTWPIEPYVFDRAPQFMIVGGLVIQELSQPFLSAWGADWETQAPRNLSRLVRTQWDRAKPGEKFIMLTQVIPSRGTVGYESINLEVISEINGVTIHTMQDVAAALKKPEGEFQHFKFEDDAPGDLYLLAASIAKENVMLQQIYGLPKLQHLDNSAE